MFGKLIKYEFKATARKMLPVLLILAVMAVLNKFLVPALEQSDNRLIHSLHMLFLIGFIVSFIAVGVVTLLVLLNRFYRNVLKDEGYLTMTLPVSTHAVIWSKLLVSFVWFIIVWIISALALAINLVEMKELLRWIFRLFDSSAISEFISEVGPVNYVLYFIETLLILVLSFVDSCLQVYASLTLGHMFRKARLLLSAVIFALISALLLTGLVNVIMWIDSISIGLFDLYGRMTDNSHALIHMMLLSVIALEAIPGAVMYFATVIGIRKRLNLE